VDELIEETEYALSVAEGYQFKNIRLLRDTLAALRAYRRTLIAEQIDIPKSEDHAAGMVLIGMAWLEVNAPHRIKQPNATAVAGEV
jgi:hypothetical protein